MGKIPDVLYAFVMEQDSHATRETDETETPETIKLQYDWFKHLTTLSSGFVLLLVALAGSVFSDVQALGFMIFAIIGFGCASVLCSATMFLLTNQLSTPTMGRARIITGAMAAAWILYLLSLLLLIVFALDNFYASNRN